MVITLQSENDKLKADHDKVKKDCAKLTTEVENVN
jgi:hypothetical protein